MEGYVFVFFRLVVLVVVMFLIAWTLWRLIIGSWGWPEIKNKEAVEKEIKKFNKTWLLGSYIFAAIILLIYLILYIL